MSSSLAALSRAVAALACIGTATLAGAKPPTRVTKDTGPKTHALYLGADVSVKYKGGLYPVVSVDGDALIIIVDGKEVPIPLGRTPVDVKIVDTLRLGRPNVEVANLIADPTYSPGNDPRRKFAREAAGAGMASAEMNQAAADLAAAQVGLSFALGLPANSPTRNQIIENENRWIDTDMQKMVAADRMQRSDLNNPAAMAGKLQDELEKKLFDAMEITFQVSATRPLKRPYMIAVSRLREHDARPGEFRSWILAKSLGRVDGTPEKVRIFESGLPAGYSLESFSLHVYDFGVEIPTNVSAKRMLLSRDEAFQFAMLEYLSAHKKDTVPATFALAAPPPDVESRLRTAEGGPTYFVKVDAAGVPGAVFADADCAQPVSDDFVVSAIKTARFNPALDQGKPVAGTARVRLRQLVN